MGNTNDKKRKHDEVSKAEGTMNLFFGEPHPRTIKELVLSEHTIIEKYIETQVEAVSLPEKYLNGEEEEETFPALVLDGASGTGKTQQAFALLKTGVKVVYLLMTDSPPGGVEQNIYTAMRKSTEISALLEKLKGAVKYYDGKEKEGGGDMLSVNSLRREVDTKQNQNVPQEIRDLIPAIKKNIIQFHGDKRKLVKVGRVETLDEVVLFVDEALPKNSNVANEKTEVHPIRLLKFTRNLGRALGMRVVIAGTASTIANMVNSNYGNFASQSQSRTGDAERGWVECEFLWRPPKEEDIRKMFIDKNVGDGDDTMGDEDAVASNPFTDENGGLHEVFKELKNERPLVASYVSDVYKEVKPDKLNLTNLLDLLGGKLETNKGIDEKSMMIWRTGAWLERKSITPSPFRLQPADLVKDHYFEPAISATSEKRPYSGRGFGDTYPESSPLRVYINRYGKPGKVTWSICLSEAPEEPRPETFSSKKSSLTESFDGVAYTMSHCVQQCLVREPLLAVALSTCEISSVNVPNNTKEIWKETSIQHSVGSVDGELHELVSFLAIQHACYGGSFPKTTTVKKFIWNLVNIFQVPETTRERLYDAQEHLWIDAGEPIFKAEELFDIDESISMVRPMKRPTKESTTEKKDLSKKEKKKKEDEKKRLERYKKNFKKDDAMKIIMSTKMPWLVPACSYEMLKEKILDCPTLFEDKVKVFFENVEVVLQPCSKRHGTCIHTWA